MRLEWKRGLVSCKAVCMPRSPTGIKRWSGFTLCGVMITLCLNAMMCVSIFAGLQSMSRLTMAVSSRSELEGLSVALLQNEMPVRKPVRLLGVSLSALQHADDAEPQLVLPM